MIFCRMQNGVVCLYLFDDQKKTCTDLHLHINGNPVQANHARHMHVSIQVTAFALRQALRPTPKMVPHGSTNKWRCKGSDLLRQTNKDHC